MCRGGRVPRGADPVRRRDEALWPLVVLRGRGPRRQRAPAVAPTGPTTTPRGTWRTSGGSSTAPSVPVPVRRRSSGPARAAAPPAQAGRCRPALEGDAASRARPFRDRDALDGGAVAAPDIEERAGGAGPGHGARSVVTAFGEARLTRASPLSALPPANIATGVEAWWDREVTLRAPWTAPPRTADDGARRPELSIDDAGKPRRQATGGRARGRPARPPADPDPGARLRADRRDGEVPESVRGGAVPGWRAVVADPSPLLGGSPRSPAEDQADLLARRSASFADRAGALLRRRRPHRARLARAPRRHRRPGVPGHGEQRDGPGPRSPATGRSGAPAVAAAQHQLPVPLRRGRRVLRAARARCCPTGSTPSSSSTAGPRPWTWHCGWPGPLPAGATSSRCGRRTTAGPTLSDAVSTSTADNPNALGTRPAWVHTVAAPNPYRGRASRRRGAPVRPRGRGRDRRPGRGRGRAGGVHLPSRYYGNAGGMALPDGYLAAVYAAVRAPRRSVPSPTRCRSATDGWAHFLGLRAAGRRNRTSSPSPRRWATATRWGR